MLDMKMLTFIKVVDCKSYTKAAEALYLTQPAVTQQIKKLDEYYGCKLIDSSSHSMNLTPAGEALYHYIHLQLANQGEFMTRLKKIEQPLRIGATLSIADYYLPDVLFSNSIIDHESFSVTVGNTERLINLLLESKIDCAFIEGIFDETLFDAHSFYHARFLPVADKNHPLAGKKIILKELFPYPLALRESGSGTRELLETYLYQHNASIHSFDRVTELGSFMLIKQMLLHTPAISFLYEAVAKQEVNAGNLAFLDIQEYSYIHPLMFIYRKNSIQQAVYDAFYKKILP